MGETEDRAYEKHRGLIRSMINSIVVNNPSIVSQEDLQQAGALALMIALKSYDPSLGSLPSYVRKCIRNALLEQANSFNGVFTVDEKVRRQANSIIKLRREGVPDDEIMNRLGIKTKATFQSLVDLVEPTVDIDSFDIAQELALDESNVFRLLEEIGLTDDELRYVNLTIARHSTSEIAELMDINSAQLSKLKSSIKEKILEWGKK